LNVRFDIFSLHYLTLPRRCEKLKTRRHGDDQ
jgi:hypothetical protein